MKPREAIGWPEGEEERTEMIENEFYGKELVKGQQRRYSLYGGIMSQGRAAAADFNINRPMGGATRPPPAAVPVARKRRPMVRPPLIWTLAAAALEQEGAERGFHALDQFGMNTLQFG